MSKMPKHLEAQRKWVEDNEKAYLVATAITGDVDKLRDVLRSVKTRVEPLMAYNPDVQPAHSAVAVVASMKERFVGLFEDLDFIEEFEDRKARYIEAVKDHAFGEDETETTS